MRPRLSVTRQAVDLIKAFEGFRAKAAKLDGGGWTIGYGHTLTAREGALIVERDAEALLLYDLIQIAHALNEHVYTPLNQNQFDALASFVFNIGERDFRGSPTLRRLNEGKLLEAALAMELWRKSDLDGERIVVDALVRRRAAEKALFLLPPEGWVAAPTPVLPPRIDYDIMSLIPLTSPVATRADLSGDRAFAEREPAAAALPPTPEPPTASETAAAAVIGRLEALMADPVAPAQAKPGEPAASPSSAVEAPPEPAAPRVLPAVERLPHINFETARPAPRGMMRRLGLLLLALAGIGLLVLGIVLHFETDYDQVLGVSPHTAGLVSAVVGIACFSYAAYLMLDRLGQPGGRKG